MVNLCFYRIFGSWKKLAKGLEYQPVVDKVSIIIPTLNEEKYLPKLLDSLLRQNFKGKLQVIVVDGNSSDRTIEVAKDYEGKFDLFVLRTWADIGHQKNVGVKNAKYNSILFIDADMILPKDTLNKFTKNINSDEKIIQSVFFIPTQSFLIHYLVFWFAHLSLAFMSFFKPTVSGGVMFTTKQNHKEIEGFKERTIAAEDIDYGERSIVNGTKFKFHYDCFVYNSTRRAKLMGTIPLVWFYIRGYLYYLRHGVLTDKTKFNYPYGQYDLNKKIEPAAELVLTAK